MDAKFEATVNQLQEPMCLPSLPEVPVVVPPRPREIRSKMSDRIEGQDFGSMEHVWVNQGVGIYENVPIVSLTQPENLKLFHRHWQIGEPALADDLEVRADLLSA